jgi:hypothetical protein
VSGPPDAIRMHPGAFDTWCWTSRCWTTEMLNKSWESSEGPSVGDCLCVRERQQVWSRSNFSGPHDMFTPDQVWLFDHRGIKAG